MWKMTGIYKAKKCGVQFNPPCVILIYEDTLSCKLRCRSMPVRNFHSSSDVVPAARLIKDRHKRYMEPVSQVVVEKMLRLIQENMKGCSLEFSLSKVEKEFEVNPEEDLNKLDTAELERKKAIMDVDFNKAKVRPGDSNFEYDKRVDFISDKRSEWDNEGEEYESHEIIPILEEVQIVDEPPQILKTDEAQKSLKKEIEDESSIEVEEEVLDSLEDGDPKLNVQFDIKDLENELRVDDADDFWS